MRWTCADSEIPAVLRRYFMVGLCVTVVAVAIAAAVFDDRPGPLDNVIRRQMERRAAPCP